MDWLCELVSALSYIHGRAAGLRSLAPRLPATRMCCPPPACARLNRAPPRVLAGSESSTAI